MHPQSQQFLDEVRAVLPHTYSVRSYLDAGGQGAIFLGELRGERVAIKIFQPSHDQRRLERELEALAKIDCPYLVKVKDFTAVSLGGGAHPVVAYEFLPGGDLRQFAGTSASETCLATIGENIGTAIETLWRNRIVHRDIKPANIVKAAVDRYVLVDIGLARHIERSALTAPGAVAGTYGYLSPEQSLGRRNLTIRSDIFSFGLTLYEAAAGRHPFGGVQQLLNTTPPQSLASLRPDLDLRLVRLVHEMMSLRPVDRPAAVAFRFRNIGV